MLAGDDRSPDAGDPLGVRPDIGIAALPFGARAWGPSLVVRSRIATARTPRVGAQQLVDERKVYDEIPVDRFVLDRVVPMVKPRRHNGRFHPPQKAPRHIAVNEHRVH